MQAASSAMGGTATAPIWTTMCGRYGSTVCATLPIRLIRRGGQVSDHATKPALKIGPGTRANRNPSGVGWRGQSAILSAEVAALPAY